MKIVLIILFVFWAVSSAISVHNDDLRQQARYEEQTKILVDLEKLNNKNVSQFVRDWKSENPNPSADDLTTLKLTQVKIQANPDDAIKFTTAEKQKGVDKIQSVVSGAGDLFGGIEAKAGAN